MTLEILVAIDPVVAVLDELGIPYAVVGSVASSAHGVSRTTLDADLVAPISGALVDRFVAALESAYYVDHDAVVEAVARRGMFKLIHLATMIKVDVYALTERPFDRRSFARRTRAALDPSAVDRTYAVEPAADIILHKLEWYRAGGEVSDRQWADVLGVLRVQGSALDRSYLDEWAATLGVSDLLARALLAAGP